MDINQKTRIYSKYPRLFNGLEYKKALTKGSYHDKKRFSKNRCLQTHIKKTHKSSSNPV